jgi:uncharacterized protein YuzE
MKATYDPEADALSVVLSDAPPSSGGDPEPRVTFFYDEAGRITGFEVLAASSVLAPGAWRSVEPACACVPGGAG